MSLNFGVSTQFNACALFGTKTLNSPVRCRLDLSGSYHLIYIRLPPEAGGAGLDIFKILDDTFGLTLPAGELVVQDAGFFSFGSETTVQADSLSAIFPDASIPDEIKGRTKPVNKSTCLWLTISIQSDALFQKLIQVGYADGKGHPPQAEISLYARLDNKIEAGQAVQSSEYTALLPDIRLLELFSFQGLTLVYRFDKTSSFSLSGTIQIELWENVFPFCGSLAVDDLKLAAKVKLDDKIPKPKSSVEPFDGKMTGIKFDDLAFVADYTFATEIGIYQVQGTIQYAQLSLTGSIFLQGATPLMACVVLNQKLSIADLFAASIPGFSWPEKLVDIIFLSGSKIYYRSDLPAPASQDPYQPGFHVHSIFDLSLLETVRIEGDIAITKNGVMASIQVDSPITIFILKITGVGDKTKGPTLTLSTVGSTSMFFACHLSFFGNDCGANVKVQIDKTPKGSTCVRGSLTSDVPLPVLGSLSGIAFAYSQDEGFQASLLQFPYASNAIDFASKFKDLVNSTGSMGCGSLTDFVFDTLLKANFHIQPSFDTESGSLFFVLNGSYDLSANGQIFATLTFPGTLRFLIPDDFTLDKLPKQIEDSLRSAAESFVQGIIADPWATAAFLVVLAGENAVRYAATMVCRGLMDVAVKAAVSAGAEALATAGGVLAGASAIAAAVKKVFENIPDKSCFVAGTKVTLANGQEMSIEDVRPGAVLMGADGAHNTVIGLDRTRLGRRSLFGFNGQAPFVTSEHPFQTDQGWCSIDPEATLRENPQMTLGQLLPGSRMIRIDNSSLELLELIESPGFPEQVLYNFLLSGDHTYFANGFLVHNKDQPQPPPPTPTPPRPSRPSNLQASCEGTTVHLSWTSSTNTSFVQVIGPLETPVGESGQISSDSFTFQIPDDSQAGGYVFRVVSIDDGMTSDPSQVSVSRLAAPNLQVGRSNSGVDPLLVWNTLSGALQCEALRRSPGATTEKRNAAAADQKIAWPFQESDAPGSYSFVTRFAGDPTRISSAWSSPSQTCLRLAPPVGIQASYSDGNLSVRWTIQSGAGRYDLRLLDPEGKIFYEGIQIVDSSTPTGTVIIPLVIVASPAPYQFQMASIPDDDQVQQFRSGWSAAVSVVVSTPASVAAQERQASQSGSHCATALTHDFRGISSLDVAKAMATAGYVASETGSGLKTAFPDISATDLIRTLAAAYGMPTDLVTLAANAHQAGKNGAECGPWLLSQDPQVPAIDVAKAMAAAGYVASETGSGLKAAFPQLDATNILSILLAAYGGS